MIDDNRMTGGEVRLPRVLVLEDDSDTLIVLGRMLSMVRADAVPANCCAAARAAVETSGPFDLILADGQLPDGDGVELAIALKSEHGCATVVMSGSDPPEDGLPAGVDLWLVKPVRLEQLQNAVRALTKPSGAG